MIIINFLVEVAEAQLTDRPKRNRRHLPRESSHARKHHARTHARTHAGRLHTAAHTQSRAHTHTRTHARESARMCSSGGGMLAGADRRDRVHDSFLDRACVQLRPFVDRGFPLAAVFRHGQRCPPARR
jgi:hypothetical protein